MKKRRRRVAEVLPDAQPERFGLGLFLPGLLEFGLKRVELAQRLLLLFGRLLGEPCFDFVNYRLGVDLVRAEIEGAGFELARLELSLDERLRLAFVIIERSSFVV